jgi:hypothetical protein
MVFEPGRLAATSLTGAYERLLPVRRRVIRASKAESQAPSEARRRAVGEGA